MSETTSNQSTSNVLDGKLISETIIEEISLKVKQLKEKFNTTPGLAVVLVGTRKDSQTYVKKKKEAAEKVGIRFTLVELPDTISQNDLLHQVQKLNNDQSIHGLIVQLPLPSQIDETTILDAVDYAKDIDGFHPLNMGALAMKGREPKFISCTPKGCMELLDRSGVKLDGKHVVVIGRSNIVGVPAALLALKRNATVTICHSRTANLPEQVRQADVIIAAVGKALLVKKDWVKPGAVVIDVGMNTLDDPTRKLGYRLVGDVDYNEVKEVASLITPVPGGVGPMTVAMLLQNTLTAAQRTLEAK